MARQGPGDAPAAPDLTRRELLATLLSAGAAATWTLPATEGVVVLMEQLPLEHPGHDLQVAVRMRCKSRSWRDQLLVVAEQQAKAGVGGVVVVAEGK